MKITIAIETPVRTKQGVTAETAVNVYVTELEGLQQSVIDKILQTIDKKLAIIRVD